MILREETLKKWSEEGYNPEVRKLGEFWVDHMEKNENVCGFTHFLELLRRFYHPNRRVFYVVEQDG